MILRMASVPPGSLRAGGPQELLVGLLADVSASMLTSIHNPSGPLIGSRVSGRGSMTSWLGVNASPKPGQDKKLDIL
jgi:hypothetical protein